MGNSQYPTPPGARPTAPHPSAPDPRAARPMPRRPSPLTRFLVIVLILLVTPIFVLGATVAATGTVTVSVRESGPNGANLFIPVPALLFDVAVATLPMLIPEHERGEARRAIAPYRPTLEAIADELEDCPPGVLVEIQQDGEEIRIRKTRRSYQIEVDGDDADVRIGVPARLLGRALDVIG